MTNQGWECPRCHAVWAPSVVKCDCAVTVGDDPWAYWHPDPYPNWYVWQRPYWMRPPYTMTVTSTGGVLKEVQVIL